jgi:hypothetical protein
MCWNEMKAQGSSLVHSLLGKMGGSHQTPFET